MLEMILIMSGLGTTLIGIIVVVFEWRALVGFTGAPQGAGIRKFSRRKVSPSSARATRLGAPPSCPDPLFEGTLSIFLAGHIYS
ncbi:hypothetical protein ACVWWO_000747 [Bradyrhizobium sp. F1.13.1]